MLDIYVDGDACPVKEEVQRVAERHELEVYFVSNGYLRPINNRKVHIILVESGPDVADNWIAERIGEGDIAITADILLAQRCLKKKASAVGVNGKLFTEENIGNVVASRALNAHLRELGDISGGNASFSKQDRSRFLQALEEVIQHIKRR